jgi:hypothetical protein
MLCSTCDAQRRLCDPVNTSIAGRDDDGTVQCARCGQQRYPAGHFDNAVRIEASDGQHPRIIVNGVDIAPKITDDWTIRTVTENDVTRVLLNVTFEVVL